MGLFKKKCEYCREKIDPATQLRPDLMPQEPIYRI